VAGLLDAGAVPRGRPRPPLPWRLDLVALDRGSDGRLSIRHHRGIP